MNITQKAAASQCPNNVSPNAGWWKSLICFACLLVWGFSSALEADTVNATFNNWYDSIISTSTSYTATGNTINFTLNFTPSNGTGLTVIRNTGPAFIQGTFSNLAQGQMVVMGYGGQNYYFIANYYGNQGRDLVLLWANMSPMAWGADTNGQLGNSSTTNSSVPVAVNAAGVLWGKYPVIGAAGGSHSLGLASDGTVAAWGLNTNGQLGNNSTTQSTVPVAVTTSSGALLGKTVVAVSAGLSHSLALCSDGTVASWGLNTNGQLGNGSTTQSTVPVAVTISGVPATRIVLAISAGSSHCMALCSDGTVVAWGLNTNGQLGNNSTTQSTVPVAVTITGVPATRIVLAISAGGSHSMALCSDGTVVTWGLNTNGQLGNNSTTLSKIPVAVNTSGVLSGKTVVGVSAGGSHSLAVCSDGTATAWGLNSSGQLGNGNTTQSTVPVAVDTTGVLSGKTVVAVSAGASHSVALGLYGTMVSWGLNSSGQLGNGGTSNSLVPVSPNTPNLNSATIAAMGSGSSANHDLSLVASPEIEISGFGIQKQITYDQTSSSAPTLDPEMPYMFTSYVQTGTMGSLLSSSTLTPAAGSTGAATYQCGSNGLQLQQNFTTKALLDAAYTAGTYSLTIQTSTPNTYNGQLTLGADNYPAIPQITGVTNATWTGGALKVTDYTKDVTIAWYNPSSAGCHFQVNNTGIYSDNITITTSFTIPGNSLQNNTAYQASIQLGNIGTASSIPGVTTNGTPAYQTQVQFNILTGTATASSLPSMYLLVKNHTLLQTSNSPPVDCLNTMPYSDPAPYSLTVQSAATGSVMGPATLSLGYQADGSNSEYRFLSSPLTSLASLNSAYPDGTYTFPGSIALALTGDAYPAATQVLTVNGGTPVWDAIGELALDPTIDNTITWTPVTVANFSTKGHEGVFFENYNDNNFNNIDLELGVAGSSTTPVTTMTILKFSMTASYTYVGNINYISAPTVNHPTNIYEIAAFQTETEFQAVALKPQTLTFGTIAAKQYPSAAFSPGATASSGLPVSYTVVSGPATVSGSNVTLVGVGTVTVKASQPGTGVYASAASATQSFAVTYASLLANFRGTNGLASDGSQDLSLPANDGVRNLLKYAFNMVGTGTGQASALSTPNDQIVGVSGTAGLPRQGTNSGKLTLTYIRRKSSATPGITYAVEFSNNLSSGSWAVNGAATESATSIDASFERVTVTDSVTTSPRFARVRVIES